MPSCQRLLHAAKADPPWHVLMRYRFQANNRCNECDDEKQSPEIGRLFEDKDPDQYRAHSANARPYSISCADGQCLCAFIQEVHADAEAYKKTNHPPGSGASACFLRFPQAGGKSDFE